MGEAKDRKCGLVVVELRGTFGVGEADMDLSVDEILGRLLMLGLPLVPLGYSNAGLSDGSDDVAIPPDAILPRTPTAGDKPDS